MVSPLLTTLRGSIIVFCILLSSAPEINWSVNKTQHIKALVTQKHHSAALCDNT